MQPIRRILFHHAVELPGGANTTDVDASLLAAPPVVDYVAGVVRIGTHEYPWASVKHVVREPMPTGAKEREPDELACPECGQKFGGGQALGAHRWQKHRIKGTSRGDT